MQLVTGTYPTVTATGKQSPELGLLSLLLRLLLQSLLLARSPERVGLVQNPLG